MVQFIPAKDDWATAFRQVGKGVQQGYMHRTDENSVRKAIADLGPNASSRDILNALTNTKTYGNEAKQQALSNYIGVENFEEMKRKAKAQEEISSAKNAINQAKETRALEKENTERSNVKSIVSQLNLPEEQKEALGNSLSKDSAESLLKEQLKPANEEKLTPFQKKLNERYADEYIKLEENIPKLEDTLNTIKYARKLSDEVGYLGTAGSYVGLSKKGKELEGVTFPLIEPILKMLAPAGAIAKEKLLRAENKYAIYGSDAPWLREAKLNALERFTKQTLNRVKARKQLIERYQGLPPENELKQFDRESETIADAMLDYDLVGEEANIPNLPPPNEYKGDEIESTDGSTYFSDGTRWLKK